jgi:MFS family permease
LAEYEVQQTETGQAESVGYIALLRGNPNYRSLWLGEVVSLFGDWFNLIASAALISSLTSSGLAVGGLFVVRMLAPFLVSPLAGVVADRFNRKWVLILSDLTRAVVVLGFLLVRDEQYAWLLYALTAVQLGISGFFFPARNAILPDIVSRRELGAANALSSATWSTMLAFGAALGGLVAGELGLYPAFLVDSASFLISAVLIYNIKYFPSPPVPLPGWEEGRKLQESSPSLSPNGKRVHKNHYSVAGGKEKAGVARPSLRLGDILYQYIDGLRYLRRHLDVLALSLHKGAISVTVNGAFQVIQVVLAERLFPIGEGGGTSLGLLFAVAGVGTGIGPILARRITGDRERPLRLALSLSYALLVLGVVVTAFLSSFAVVLFGSFLRAFGGGIIWVFSTQLLLHEVPGEMRGRVFSTEFAFFTLGNAISTAIGGWVLDSSPLDLTGLLWLMAGLGVVPGVLWTFWMVRKKGSRGLAISD